MAKRLRKKHRLVVLGPAVCRIMQFALILRRHSTSVSGLILHHFSECCHRRYQYRFRWVATTHSSTFFSSPRRSVGSVRQFSTLLCPVDSVDVEEETDECAAPLCNALLTHRPAPPPLFDIQAPFEPTGDQPAAIQHLVTCVQHRNDQYCVLKGATGTGKTFAMASLIHRLSRPALVLCHNKTLAAQLCRELSAFLPNNAVELFISYYNHYRPESFKESTSTYLAKKSSRNPDIDVLRHCATRSLVTRRDVVVVASVSSIFGAGMPQEYVNAAIQVSVGDVVPMNWVEESLQAGLLYELYDPNHETDPEGPKRFDRGMFETTEWKAASSPSSQEKKSSHHGKSIVTCWPPCEAFPIQIHLSPTNNNDDQRVVTAIRLGFAQGFRDTNGYRIFPARHHLVPESRLNEACSAIEDELHTSLTAFRQERKVDEADRLQKRVLRDLDALRNTGFCQGVENYSRHLAGREAGEPPITLLDYFDLLENDWLLLVDESHVTLPQLKAMYAGDRKRKEMLVKHGFRLPSALDNRPLKDEEFWHKVPQAVFVSATPGKRELALCTSPPAEMMIRPTFVCDPVIHVRPRDGQLQDLLGEILIRVEKKQRTIAVTLTKRDAEDLASYMCENGIKATYVHSNLKTKERSDAIKALQSGEVDCLVGVNLLREGLDIPQVSLVAILSADSEGFLRGETALLQSIGRAARNVDGTAIFYANKVTDSMDRCIKSTAHRRSIQLEYNAKFGREMKSTQGSSALSIFDILQERIASQSKVDPTMKEQTNKEPSTTSSTSSLTTAREIDTGHIPSSPGVYFWKDYNDNILYIGKAKDLRSRVKSYLAQHGGHSVRIRTMVSKATTVEFILTPSDRDALVLESKLIKLHQPPFNVLLKDDEHYPYICASVGDDFPRLSVVPYREPVSESRKARYQYFGPYTNFKEVNAVLDKVEDTYNLRIRSFQARHGEGTMKEYQDLFLVMLHDVFESKGNQVTQELVKTRIEFESAGELFDSPYNVCRDVVAAAPVSDSTDSAVVLLLQLRDGTVTGKYTYVCHIPFGDASDADLAASIQTVLEHRHYPLGRSEQSISPDTQYWFPKEILLSHTPNDLETLSASLKQCRAAMEGSGSGSQAKSSIRITGGAQKGKKRISDERTLEFALANVQQAALDQNSELQQVDSSHQLPIDCALASSELANLLHLPDRPIRLECYDISHTQGSFPVGSSVVFIDGKPVPKFYRRFNIQAVDGVDDFASLEEVLERRFRRVWKNGVGGTVSDAYNPWGLPDLVVIDGGIGQLGAAIKGMSKVGVFPSNGAVVANGHTPVCNSLTSTNTFQKAEVAVCALAKRNEDVFVYGNSSPVNLANDSPGMLLLRQIRDESHRFALNSHRNRRSILKSD